MELRFANPALLWALLAVPAAALMMLWATRRKRRIMERLASAALLPHLVAHHNAHVYWLKPLLLLVALAAAVFASARPQWGHEDRRIVSRGIDLMVAVDVSTSMLAQDHKPNRLTRAKELLQNILWKARGDRVAVMAFAGNSYIQCPLTLDYTMARTALEALNPGAVSSQGTAIGTAIESAVKAFESASSGERILVLLTDGEDQGSNPIEAAQAAAKAKLRIYTIGIGTTQGMPIPMPDGKYKQDQEGKLVNSRLDWDTLAKIAALTGGKAIKANATGSAELDVIVSDLDQLQQAEQQDQVFRVYTERYQWFLMPAILLLVWELLETGYTRRARAWKGRVIGT